MELQVLALERRLKADGAVRERRRSSKDEVISTRPSSIFWYDSTSLSVSDMVVTASSMHSMTYSVSRSNPPACCTLSKPSRMC